MTSSPPFFDAALAGQLFERDGLPALAEYTSIECLSPDFDRDWASHGEIDRAIALLASWCIERHLPATTVEIVRLEGRTPVLLCEIAATPDASNRATTLVYGHFDKQPPLGEWRDGLQPFTAVRIGDRLYGRGTADDGYAVFAAFAAVGALVAADAPHGRIVVLIEGSEESGSPDLDAYLDHLRDRLGELELVICLDSGCISYDRLWVTTSLRGVVSGTLRVDVLEVGVHSGHAGGIVPSSFRIARELLDRIEDPRTGEILLRALWGDIPAHRAVEASEVARAFGEQAAGIFPTLTGLRLDATSPVERLLNGTWRPALAVIGQSGMPDAEIAGNVLRPFTALKLSIRLPPTVDAAAAALAVRDALLTDPPSGARVSFTLAHPAQGWDAPPLQPWLQERVEIASLRHFGAAPGSLGLGGSIPFMASLGNRYPGTQFLATGVLGPESNAHGPNEFLHVPTAKSVASCIAEVLAAIN